VFLSYGIQLRSTPVPKYYARKRRQKTGNALTNGSIPEEKIITKGIESWKGFTDTLNSEEDKKQFLKMLK
jgi:hypothetical protein